MDENTQNTPAPIVPNIKLENVSSEKKSFLKRRLLLILGLVIIIPLLILLLSSLFKGNPVITDNTSAPSVGPYEIVNSQNEINKEVIKNIAQEIIAYIKSQKRPDGYYNYVAHFDDQCPSSKNPKDCPFAGINMFETTNTWGALALYAGSKILDDTSLLNEAQQDILKLQTFCINDRSQCNWVLVQPAIIYKTTNSPELFAFLNLQAEALLNSPISDNPMLAAIEARSNVLLYEITNDFQHLERAQRSLAAASSSLQKSSQNIFFSSETHFRAGSCWLALGSIEYARKTDNNFSNVIAFLENGKLNENFSQIMVPSEIQPCIESYISLYDATNKPLYLTEAQTLMKLLIQTFYDGQEDKKVYGEGGTKFINAGRDSASEKIVTLTDSAYTLYLLSLLYKYEN